MNVTVLKIILLAVMTVVTLIFGIAPIFVMKYITRGNSTVLSHKASMILSLISCFAGGVFLGVCFLDIMPDALDAMNEVKVEKKWTSDYPLVPLIFCLGFFFVYIFEELAVRLCGHSHEDEEKVEKIDIGDECGRQRAETFHSIVNKNIAVVELGKPKENKIVNSLTFVTAFLFHVGLEGFAFGVQDSMSSVVSLFFGIIVHKAVVCFSIGMRLVRDHPGKNWLVFLLIGIVALINPIGGAIGIVVENSNINETAKDLVTAILLSFSLGVFIYITFFEILCPEHSNRHNNLAQWLSSFIGFVVIALLMMAG